MGVKTLLEEWRARRKGRRSLHSDLSRSAREVIGPTGWMWSKGWDTMAEHTSAYVKSFDRQVPPSIFVSERERSRYNIPIPLSERMVSEHGKKSDAEESPAHS